MPISNDPSVLAGASRCFDTCISPGEHPAVKTYLLAQLAGVTDPGAVMTGARCFSSCIPPGSQGDVQAYLSAVLSGGSTDPTTLLNNATCFRSCVPPGAAAAVASYALASKAGGTMDPGTLANLARCFSSCIPPGMQTAAQSYLLGVLAHLTDASTVFALSTCFRCTDPHDPTIADEMITRWVVGGFPGPGGGGSGGGGGGGPTNPLTTLWLAQVVANGGPPPSNSTGTAINTLFNALDACGVTSKILSFCMFVPDSLIAATTPLIAGTTNPWTNLNFVGGDLTVNGLTGNGTNKTLTPGISPAFAGPQFTLTSCSIFFYAHTANSTVVGTDVGTTDGANDAVFVSNFNFGGLATFSDLLGVPPRLSVATPGNGFYMASRIAAADNKIYFANSGTAWSAIASNAIGSSGFATTGFLVFGYNNNGVISQWANSTLSCAGFAAGLTSAEGQCLFNAVQACRVALGGGFR